MVHKVEVVLVIFFFFFSLAGVSLFFSEYNLVKKMCICCLLLLLSEGLFLMGSLGPDTVAIIINKILNGMWTVRF